MPVDFFAEALANFGRIAITGGPRTGKSTLVQRVDPTTRPVLHGDDYIHLGWSESSQALCDAANAIYGPVVIEGVQVPRALRKGMRVDVVIWLDEPLMTPNERHIARRHNTMKEGCWNVMQAWRAANPAIPFLIPAPVHVRRALPVQLYPEPNDYDEAPRRKQGVRR
jgi:hypothetical protein